MNPATLRWFAALSSRGGKVLVMSVIACGALMLYLLLSASSNTSFLEGQLHWVIGGAVVIVLMLMLLSGYQLLILRQRLRQRVFGSKLTLRLVLLFALVALLPGALVYAVSVQFLTRSIDTWFDVRVETALESGLSLGRSTLETMLKDLRGKASSMALSLADHSPRAQLARLTSLREQAAVEEAAIFDQSGNLIGFSSDSKESLAPLIPTSEMMQSVRLQKPFSRVTSDPQKGLMLRVVVPVNLFGGTVEGLQLIQRVPDHVSRNADAVQEAFREYQELMYSRPGLKQLYALSLTLALLLSLLAALLLAIYFSERLSAPLGVLAEGTRAVAQGDFREMESVKSYDELGILTRSFNAMTRDLSEAQAATRRYQEELEDAKASVESILASLSAGVIAVDSAHRLLSFNPSASRILGVDLSLLQARPVALWADVDPRLIAISAPLSHLLSGPLPRIWEREILYPGAANELTLLVRVSSIAQTDETEFVIVFDDITHLLRAQRQAAWGEVARRLAHEIKNPLTPIQLSAERLQQRLHRKLESPDADMLSRLTQTIVNQVTALKGMVDAFSQYARSPETALQPLDLATLTSEVLGLYETTSGAIQSRMESGLPTILGDASKLRQVIHNLLRNAEDAVSSVTMPRIVVSVERAEGGVALRVADNGAGFPATYLERSIEPYVTTKAKGTGLGLAIVHKIIEEHQGSMHLENLVAGGARVSVVLPVALSEGGRGEPSLRTEKIWDGQRT